MRRPLISSIPPNTATAELSTRTFCPGKKEFSVTSRCPDCWTNPIDAIRPRSSGVGPTNGRTKTVKPQCSPRTCAHASAELTIMYSEMGRPPLPSSITIALINGHAPTVASRMSSQGSRFGSIRSIAICATKLSSRYPTIPSRSSIASCSQIK